MDFSDFIPVPQPINAQQRHERAEDQPGGSADSVYQELRAVKESMPDLDARQDLLQLQFTANMRTIMGMLQDIQSRLPPPIHGIIHPPPPPPEE